MDIKRYDTILFNAIDLLLQTMNREQIMEELGMSKSEFEAVGGLMETPNKKLEGEREHDDKGVC